MPRRLAFAVVPLAILALLAAGCGGSDSTSSSDDTTPTIDWADSLCTAIVDWTDSLSASVTSLRSGNLSRSALEDVVDEAKTSTETLIDDLKGLGTPDTAAGEEAQDSLNQLADDLQEDVDDIESAIGDSSANIVSTISTVSDTLVTMGNQLTTTFSQLEQLDAQGELEVAFNQAGACQQLTG